MDLLTEKLFDKYISGTCSEEEMEQLLKWLEASEENRKEWLKLRIALSKSNFIQFSDPDHISDSYKELYRRQIVHKDLKKKIALKFMSKIMRYAACILLLIGLSLGVHFYLPYFNQPVMNTFVTGGDTGITQILLDDGTRVWMSANSRIEYPKKFDKKERAMIVEGKVFFDVTKDIERPFLVKTDAYTVKVLGTSFEVSAYKNKPVSEVILKEGHVDILDPDLALLCSMKPGQKFEINKVNRQYNLDAVDAGLYTSWSNGKLEFDGITLEKIIKALERNYNIHIILDPGIDKDKQLTGSLSFQKNINEMMKTLELIVPMKYAFSGDTIMHIRPK